MVKVILISVHPGGSTGYFLARYVWCNANYPPERRTTGMYGTDELDVLLKFKAECLRYGYEVEVGEGDGADTAG